MFNQVQSFLTQNLSSPPRYFSLSHSRRWYHRAFAFHDSHDSNNEIIKYYDLIANRIAAQVNHKVQSWSNRFLRVC